jgi:hypothetical protein
MRPSPLPIVFPALGHDISTTSRAHPEDLSAQKVNLSVPRQMQTSHPPTRYNLGARKLTVNEIEMDLGIIAAVIMIVVWAVLTFTTEAPGYVHLLLTIGFFVLFWRVAARGSGKQDGKTRKG